MTNLFVVTVWDSADRGCGSPSETRAERELEITRMIFLNKKSLNYCMKTLYKVMVQKLCNL